MRFSVILIAVFTLITTILSTRSASAYERELNGPFALGEAAYRTLDGPIGGDFMAYGRVAAGYTFKPGIQAGMGVAGYYVDRTSLCVSGGVDVAECFLSGKDEHTFWTISPVLGYNLEFSTGLVGMQFTAMPSLPITSGTTGWTMETGANLYLSLESVTDGTLPVAIMGGLKHSYMKLEFDQGDTVEGSTVVPTAGLMAQF